MEEEGITCPGCNTVNETGWSFCQQCGKRLPKSAQASEPAPDLKAAAALKTVAEKQPAIDASDLKTVKEKSPAFEQPLKTVREKSPAFEQALKTVAEKSPAAEPAAADIVESPVPTPPPASEMESSSSTPTIVVEAAAPPPAEAGKQPGAPAVSASEPTTQHVHSVSGVLCNQCGQSNNVGSAFCASCGAPITQRPHESQAPPFGKTKVMSSMPAAGGGRLHLVMEGGQPGEVYELGEDTVIGRSSGDITFPHDGFMSGRHARIVRRGDSFVLVDENSRNGTFIKIKDEIELQPGDTILVGKQLFRFEA